MCDRSMREKANKIPTLREVFETVDRQAIVNIELKGSNTAKLVVELIQEYLQRGWSERDFVVSSFDHYELNLVKTSCPQIVTGMLIYGIPWNYLTMARQLQTEIVISSLDFITSKLVRSVHQQNLSLWVYTVNQFDDIKHLKELQVDAIFTNYPERVIFN